MADEEKREEGSVEDGGAERDAGSREVDTEEAAKVKARADEALLEEKKAEDDIQAKEARGEEAVVADGPVAKINPDEKPPMAHLSPGSGDHHGDHGDHLGHTAPMSLLIGVLVALGMLTVLTVAVTALDLGSQGNFVVAMVIATVKAVLVMGYFMHMFWDAKFNVVAFTSSFLFVLLFLAMTLLDRSEYQDSIDTYEVDKKLQSM